MLSCWADSALFPLLASPPLRLVSFAFSQVDYSTVSEGAGDLQQDDVERMLTGTYCAVTRSDRVERHFFVLPTSLLGLTSQWAAYPI